MEAIKKIDKKFRSGEQISIHETIAILVTASFTALIALALFSAFAYNSKQDIIDAIEQKLSTTEKSDEKNEESVAEERSCNTQIISLRGELTPYISTDPDALFLESGSLDICRNIERAEQDDMVKAIVMEVDSPGGNPFAAEEIEKCIKRSSKPVVAYIRDAGTSAAYWSITSADRIFASALSRVGSIGVYISYLDDVKKNKMEGREYHLYSTGKFKDILSSDKPVTHEEERLIMAELHNAHDIFVKTIAENRQIDMETLKKISDGRVFNGEQAALIGLTDEVGGLFEVAKYIEEKYLNGDAVVVCEG